MRGATINNRGHFATEKGAQMQISINIVQIVCNFLFISVASKHLPHKNITCPWFGCEMSNVQNNAARKTGRVRGTAKVRDTEEK